MSEKDTCPWRGMQDATTMEECIIQQQELIVKEEETECLTEHTTPVNVKKETVSELEEEELDESADLFDKHADTLVGEPADELSAFASAATANQMLAQQGSINDDIALMVAQPDVHGFFRCPVGTCDRKYKIKYSLLRHLRNECIGNRRYSCPKCDKKFSYSFIMNRHLLNVHKDSHNPGFF
ncbi:uncharacterized protein LOC126575462 [Anopheles aquasalis]|uniref:uncharacterized protein LOC126575462 n=1 Tax=Anopheles aquasalis TaxID=42839 RepID=UPI00215A3D0B|nr:uncharacterized protein LOC126575462 [Anopheles aquasalis]